jgi:hypothetical protein
MSKKYNYYRIDAGFFKVQIQLCFSDKDFQDILKDHEIDIKANALDTGIGETHYISDGRDGIIVLALDMKECDLTPAYLAGVIAHEATHCVNRIFDHIGEEPEDIGEETRAYLTEHIVAQLTQAVIIEKEKNARKTNRTVPKQKGEGSGGSELQVDINNNGGAGSDSDPKPKGKIRRAKDSDGSVVTETKTGLQGTRRAWISYRRNPK